MKRKEMRNLEIELKIIFENLGLQYIGIQKSDSFENDIILFNDRTGTTLAIYCKYIYLSIENFKEIIKQKVNKSREFFGTKDLLK